MKKSFTQSIQILSINAFIICALVSCGKSTNTKVTDEKKDSVEQQVVVPQKVELSCNNRGADEYEVPYNEVVLTIDGKSQILDTIRSSCNVITPEEYEAHEIPKDAKSACGGWWAGAGDYFYAIIKDNKVKVFQGWQAEEQEDNGYHWKEIPIRN